MWMGLANSYATNSSGIRRQRGRRMEFVPRDGVERVDASCSISRARFIRKTLVLVLFHILLHFTKVVARLTRRGTGLVHFYGQLLYIDRGAGHAAKHYLASYHQSSSKSN